MKAFKACLDLALKLAKCEEKRSWVGDEIGIKCDMRYCRKLFASHLRTEGIQPEIIDMLQGRVSQSILTRHYLVPKPSFKDDILKALEQLQRQLPD
jgi:intergrase/recombinase